jgi:flagellar biosynthetic protein FliO
MLDQLKQAWERLRSVKGFTTWLWIVALFVMLAIGLLMNDPLPPVNGEAGGGAFGSTGLALSVFFRWMAVIGLMYIAFIFIRKWQMKNSGQPQKRITVVDRFHFSPKQALYLVNVDGREYLLGATDASINLITEMNSAEPLMDLDPEFPKDFDSLLRNKKDTMDVINHE